LFCIVLFSSLTKQWNDKNTKNESTFATKKLVTLAITFLNAGLFLVDRISLSLSHTHTEIFCYVVIQHSHLIHKLSNSLTFQRYSLSI
jgi:hypothetical protein